MSIQTQLDEDMKSAMREKRQDALMCIRQVKSKVQEAMNAQDFKGPADDAFYVKIIASYSKQIEKGIAELLPGGEKTKPLRDKYAAEIVLLKKYMPETLDAAATEVLVREAIAKSGANAKAQAGRVVGVVMKEHKGKVDAALVKSLAEKLLP